MRTHMYNELCHLRKHYGVCRPVFWHNELEYGCNEHLKYMLFHKICQHAPNSMLNGAFECVASFSYHTGVSNETALTKLLYDNIVHSHDHLKLILEADYIAAAIGGADINGGREYYLCIRGY